MRREIALGYIRDGDVMRDDPRVQPFLNKIASANLPDWVVIVVNDSGPLLILIDDDGLMLGFR